MQSSIKLPASPNLTILHSLLQTDPWALDAGEFVGVSVEMGLHSSAFC